MRDFELDTQVSQGCEAPCKYKGIEGNIPGTE